MSEIMKGERMAKSDESLFAKRVSVEAVEEGDLLAPKFDAEGLIPVVTTAANSGEVLMLGYMNREALQATLDLMKEGDGPGKNATLQMLKDRIDLGPLTQAQKELGLK